MHKVVVPVFRCPSPCLVFMYLLKHFSLLLPCVAPRPPAWCALCLCVCAELIVHENLEVMSVGEALATAESEQQQGLPLQILDEQISEPQERRVVTTKTDDCTIACSPALDICSLVYLTAFLLVRSPRYFVQLC